MGTHMSDHDGAPDARRREKSIIADAGASAQAICRWTQVQSVTYVLLGAERDA
jgi:hypothetical protein